MKILVVIEHDNKNIKQSSFSTITAANEMIQCRSHYLGKDLDKTLDSLKKSNGLKKIYAVDSEIFENPIAENLSLTISKFIDGKSFTHILSPSSTFKICRQNCRHYLMFNKFRILTKVINKETFERPIYAGNAIAKVKSNDPTKVITVRSTCFEPVKLDSNVEIEKLSLNVDKNSSINFVKYDQSKSDRPELTSAKIIISGGRGMQNGDNFKLLEGIADKLGAAMGASRAAVDAGFVPNDWQVGQTGKIVAPDLYIAVGISGAIQHIAGIKRFKIHSLHKQG